MPLNLTAELEAGRNHDLAGHAKSQRLPFVVLADAEHSIGRGWNTVGERVRDLGASIRILVLLIVVVTGKDPQLVQRVAVEIITGIYRAIRYAALDRVCNGVRIRDGCQGAARDLY